MPITVSLKKDRRRIERQLWFHGRRVFPRATNLAVGRTTDKLYTRWVRQTSSATHIQAKKLRAKYTGRLMKFFRHELGIRIGRLWLGSRNLTFEYIGAVTGKGKLSKRGREIIGASGATPFRLPVAPGSAKTILAARVGDQIMTGVNIYEQARQILRRIVATDATRIFTQEFQSQAIRLSHGKIRRG